MNSNYYNPNLPPSFYQPAEQNDTMEIVLRRIPSIKVKVYMTFPGSNEWRDKVFDGILEGTGRDHIVVSDITTGSWYILPNIYVDYVEFYESIQKYLRNS